MRTLIIGSLILLGLVMVAVSWPHATITAKAVDPTASAIELIDNAEASYRVAGQTATRIDRLTVRLHTSGITAEDNLRCFVGSLKPGFRLRPIEGDELAVIASWADDPVEVSVTARSTHIDLRACPK